MQAADLFCCAGGAGKGLLDAGFDKVVGFDVDPGVADLYPGTFLLKSALEVSVRFLRRFDFIWSSPPCQRFTRATKQHGRAGAHPDLIDATRRLLLRAGVPFVIENVVDTTPVRPDLMLCGKMFGLDVARHRLFEVHGFEVEQPFHPWPHPGRIITVTGNPGGSSTRDGGSRFGTTAEWKAAMGIDWMPARYIREAIPPAYSRYIGEAFIKGR